MQQQLRAVRLDVSLRVRALRLSKPTALQQLAASRQNGEQVQNVT
jgi:hypothetical protein